MSVVALILIALVALLHIYILILEMFLWTGPRGQKAFGLTPEFAQDTKALAANQGLYNGFLACVAVAGIFGAATASRKILFIQTVPAVVAMLAVMFL